MRVRLRRASVAFAVFALLALAGLALSVGRANQEDTERQTLLVHGRRIAVLIADSVSERTRGLGGRERLPSDAGMLFVFSEPGRYGIWMKDMRFPLDVVWLEETTPALAESPLIKGALPSSAGGLFGTPFTKGETTPVSRFPEKAGDSPFVKGNTDTPSNSPLKRGRGEKALRVVDVRLRVATSTYPEVFYPMASAQYVLEVNAGAAEQYQLKTGDIVIHQME